VYFVFAKSLYKSLLQSSSDGGKLNFNLCGGRPPHDRSRNNYYLRVFDFDVYEQLVTSSWDITRIKYIIILLYTCIYNLRLDSKPHLKVHYIESGIFNFIFFLGTRRWKCISSNHVYRKIRHPKVNASTIRSNHNLLVVIALLHTFKKGHHILVCLFIGTSIPPFLHTLWYLICINDVCSYNKAGNIDIISNTRKVDNNNKEIIILNVYNRFINNEITIIEYLKLLLDVKYCKF